MWLRAAGGVRAPGAHGLRRRPVDVLQASARGPRVAVRRRHPRDAALPAAPRADRRAAPDRDARSSSSSTPGTCPTRRRRATAQSTSRARSPPTRSTRTARRLRYFHGPGLFELGGDDYRGVFRIGEFSDDVLPPYTELVRFDAGPRLEGEDLRRAAAQLLRRHLERRPRENPFDRFGQQLEQELPALLDGGLERYHAYAFATVRMAGSAFEILADHARWLIGRPGAAGRGRHARDRRWMQGAVVPARQAPPVRLRAADRRAGRRVGRAPSTACSRPLLDARRHRAVGRLGGRVRGARRDARTPRSSTASSGCPRACPEPRPAHFAPRGAGTGTTRATSTPTTGGFAPALTPSRRAPARS